VSEHPRWATPVVTRSKLVLEVASELVGRSDWGPQQARLTMRYQGAHNPWEVCLFGSDAPSAFEEVARGEADLAIINPAEPLTMALRGTGPFKEPLPVRTITVIPSADAFLFAVAGETGITSLEEIKARKYPLRISMRSQPDHSDYLITNTVLGALGFSLDDIVSWGGKIHTHPYPPNPGAVTRGEVDAVFDEAVDNWAPHALSIGMRFMPIDEALMQQLEAVGLRRRVIPGGRYPGLAEDFLALDFSGWPVFTRADAPDDFVRKICESLEARKDRIPWQGTGPLPLERMCVDADDTPMAAPLHPAAENFWRERGYLK
jgi:TRAP-type uncharacterized transport system substrate-binding protein